jgi:hypothetical protein
VKPTVTLPDPERVVIDVLGGPTVAFPEFPSGWFEHANPGGA